jgi:hypothetical protein
MNDKINISKESLEMLKSLLHACEGVGGLASSIKYDEVVKYEYSISDSEKLIDLYEFRISRAIQKSSAIVDLIEKVKQNNEPRIIVHNLGTDGGGNFMIYSSIDCKKIIAILPFGSGAGTAVLL